MINSIYERIEKFTGTFDEANDDTWSLEFVNDRIRFESPDVILQFEKLYVGEGVSWFLSDAKTGTQESDSATSLTSKKLQDFFEVSFKILCRFKHEPLSDEGLIQLNHFPTNNWRNDNNVYVN